MIISRTPFRISFFGGGTDYPVWYEEHGGLVLSATINKYCYVTVRKLPPFFEYKNRIRYYKKEETKSIAQIEHPSVRETALFLGIEEGFEIVHSADLPAQSGLGSSSTFTVGLLNALHGLKNCMPTKRQLALESIHIEQRLIGEAVGSQDQTAAAFGGLNKISFSRSNIIDVDPVLISNERLLELQEHLLLCFTGFARTASAVAQKQIEQTHLKTQELLAMRELCEKALVVLTDANKPISEFGQLLDSQWRIKRKLTDLISNNQIDEIYNKGMESGAIGGKLLGAGSGGFMLFFAPPNKHGDIRAALRDKLFVPFRFENTGSKIVYFAHE
jgi:D-glycero-alpha-D-manno-heptose-7-phosphate kinase